MELCLQKCVGNTGETVGGRKKSYAMMWEEKENLHI